MKNHLKNNALIIFCFFIISAIFLYFFSFSTSSLYKNIYGFDSAIFMVVGKSMANNRLLYSEIFDHKGPILFLFQYIGWSIAKIKGIFLLQCINLTGVIYILYKMILLLNISKQYIVLLIIGLFSLLCFTNIEGNQSEEYSLLFIFIPVFIVLKYIFNKKEVEHPIIYSFLYGVCFSLVAFNRITNGVSIISIVAGLCLFLLIKSKFQNFFRNIIGFLCGIVITSAIITIPFLYQGTTYDMLYATFIFNLKYTQSINNLGIIDKLFTINIYYTTLKIIPNLFLIIILSIRYIKTKYNKELCCFIFIPIGTYVSINLGLSSNHYLTINAVPLILGLLLYLLSIKEAIIKKRSFLNICVILYITLMLLFFSYQGKKIFQIYKNIEASKQSNHYYFLDIDLVKTLIKENEKNSVFGYNLPADWYLKVDMDIIPPFRYFTNQENWIKADSSVYFETNNFLRQTPPKWIIIPNKRVVPWVKGVDANPVLKKILEKDYLLQGEDVNNKYYQIIKRD